MPKKEIAPKQALSVSELKNLEEEKRDLEQMIKDVNGAGPGSSRGSQIDVDRIKKNITYLDEQITDHSPKKIRPYQKDKMADRASYLADKIKEGMPDWDQMRRPNLYPGIIRQNFEWNKRNANNIKEYKQIMRNIDPNRASIERLRRMK